jgi:hypothetical protein
VTTLESHLVNSLSFFFFAADYFGKNTLPLAKDWTPDTALVDSFRAFAAKRGVKIEDADFQHDREWIASRLKEEFFITAFSKDDADRLALDNDQEIRKGVDSLPQSKALIDKAKEVVANRQALGSKVVER